MLVSPLPIEGFLIAVSTKDDDDDDDDERRGVFGFVISLNLRGSCFVSSILSEEELFVRNNGVFLAVWSKFGCW